MISLHFFHHFCYNCAKSCIISENFNEKNLKFFSHGGIGYKLVRKCFNTSRTNPAQFGLQQAFKSLTLGSLSSKLRDKNMCFCRKIENREKKNWKSGALFLQRFQNVRTCLNNVLSTISDEKAMVSCFFGFKNTKSAFYSCLGAHIGEVQVSWPLYAKMQMSCRFGSTYFREPVEHVIWVFPVVYNNSYSSRRW